MTVVLCIETSSEHCSVALRCGDATFEHTAHLRRAHNEHLLHMLDDLYAEAGVRPLATDVVGFGCGPGSFTGVRIAAAAAQAFALAAAGRVVPVPSPLVLALNAREATAYDDWLVCTRSRASLYYLTRYHLTDESIVEAQPTVLADTAPGWVERSSRLVGELPPWLQTSAVGAYEADVVPAASAMLSRVQAAHLAGASLAPELALPTYVEGDSPWRKKRSD